MDSFEARIAAAREAARAHAVWFGTALPRVRKPKLGPQSIALGSCSRALFAPTGTHLVATTANGSFLWDLVARKKLRLKTVANPDSVVFRADGSECLISNSVSEFSRIALPTGELVGRFKARYDKRLDGTPAYTDDREVIATQAYDGRLLLLDARNGTVRREVELWSGSVYGRSIHYQHDPGVLWIVVSPTTEHREYSRGTKLFRWHLSEAESPESYAQRWHDLHLALTKDERHAVLLYRPNGPDDEFRAEVRDTQRFEPQVSAACGAAALPYPSCSDDLRFAYATEPHALWEIDLASRKSTALPADFAYVDCAPESNLIAVGGKHAHVLAREELHRLAPTLADEFNLGKLKLRRFSRITTLPDKVLPPRALVFETPDGFYLQPQRPITAKYVSTEHGRSVAKAPRELGRGLLDVLTPSVADEASATFGAAGERQSGFLSGHIANPPTGATRCVVVSSAADLIEITSAKSELDGTFTYDTWPSAAIQPNTGAADLGRAVIAMFEHCSRAR